MPATYRIGEVAVLTGVTVETLGYQQPGSTFSKDRPPDSGR